MILFELNFLKVGFKGPVIIYHLGGGGRGGFWGGSLDF